jgi:hypothetical protein
MSKIGIDPKATKGQVTAELGFRFPARKDLTFDDVELTVTADLADVAVVKAMLDQDFTEGDLKLALDKDGMKIVGNGKFAAAPIDVQWEENF